MGRIRKFTQEAYDALQSGVSDDGEILDFFSDIPLNISNFFNSLELEDDLSNFQSYLRDISDFENYTAKKIDDIFRDVINVDETYATLYRLQGPESLLTSKCGVCWDQVELERYYFSLSNYEFKTYIIVYFKDDTYPSHTFLIYKIDNDYYCFEHSWEKYRGIRKYSSENSASNDIKEKFINDELNNNYDDTNLFIFKYSKPR